ncbi:hypothetical protein [Verminephrobacter eiseniae]|uniref:hypothetical protein n=1 Tax=Verminephrobacter eiseniae TaxID=364317 RepID=UPI00223801F0|nr:hypothetical protein [Verminephrobacter eiseniae]
MSRHRSSVGLRWPSQRGVASLANTLGICIDWLRLALRSDGCAQQPATSDR